VDIDAQKLIDQMRRNHTAELERLHFEKAVLEVQLRETEQQLQSTEARLQEIAASGAVIVRDETAPTPEQED
jgi:hypothetical protein